MVVFVLALLCVSFSARADEASRRAKAKEMLSLLHMDQMMAQMMDGMTQQMSAMTKQMGGGSVRPEDQAKLDEFQKKVLQLIEAQVSWKSLEPEYVDLYAKEFTDEQLDAIVTFYKSPAGVAMVEKLPTLTNEGMQIAQSRIMAIQPQLKQMIEDFAKSQTPAALSPPAPPRPPTKTTPQ
jgi:uncharacterized protein